MTLTVSVIVDNNIIIFILFFDNIKTTRKHLNDEV